MIVCDTLDSLREALDSLTGTVGFVPTMGALHDGHKALIRDAVKYNDHCVVSIYVNPAQFAPHEDLATYPRPLTEDIALLEKEDVSLLCLPSTFWMYPSGISKATQVYIPALSKKYCGRTRKHFFRGITTVVARLLNLVRPTRAYFGEKDFQQLFLIKKMVADLFMPVEIIAVPVVRDYDGLAKSSRNTYLSVSERKEASELFNSLDLIRTAFLSGEERVVELLNLGKSRLDKTSVILEYIVIVNPETLQERRSKVHVGDRLLTAAVLGKTRLIDTIELR